MYTALVSHVIFPLHERLKGHDSVRVRRELERTQWWPRERLAQLQLERLRALLTRARQNVPYYRQAFRDAGFEPGAVQAFADLRALPLLTKPLIRANLERLKSERSGSLHRFNTGGSSGEPLIFFIGKERISHDVAAKWRATRWWGVDIGDRETVVWGSPIEVGAQDRLRTLRDRILRTTLLPAFEMSEARLDHFIAQIRAQQPQMLFGYPSALNFIAQHAEKRGIAMDDLGIRVAFVTSERLYDDQRSRIGKVFGCRVANGYGGRDAGFIAHECPAGGMHITAEDIIVETIRPDGSPCEPGEAGEIVTTHLATGEFPFIRYRTGDVGVLGETQCACGRGLPLLQQIHGRTTDFVVAQDGTVMHGLALIYVLRDLPGVEAFRVVQHSRDRTTVKLVVDSSVDRGAHAASIVRGFQRRLGERVLVDVEFVEEIAAEKSGKFRYIVSDIANAAMTQSDPGRTAVIDRERSHA